MNRKFFYLCLVIVGISWSTVAFGQEEGESMCAEHRSECAGQKSENLGLCQQDYDPISCGDDQECVKSLNEERTACMNESNQIYTECMAECQE